MGATVADTLQFEHKYTPGVIAWAPEDKPSDAQINRVVDEFEKTAWAGLEPDRYSWAAVQHREAGGDMQGLTAGIPSRRGIVRLHLCVITINCIHNWAMEFEWDEVKNQANIRKHGVSFDTAKRIFEGPRVTWPVQRPAKKGRFTMSGYDRPLTPVQIAAVKDESIDFSDIPELDETFWKQAKLIKPDHTEQITLRVKHSVLTYFQSLWKGLPDPYQPRARKLRAGRPAGAQIVHTTRRSVKSRPAKNRTAATVLA